MKFVVDCDIVLSQEPSGPIAAYVEPFAKSLREQGYASQSITDRFFYPPLSANGWRADNPCCTASPRTLRRSI